MDIQAILHRFADGIVTGAEREEFAAYLKTLTPSGLEELMKEYEALLEKEQESQRVEASSALAADPVLLQHIETAIGHLERLEWDRGPNLPIRKRTLAGRMVYIPAASILLIVTVCFLLVHRSGDKEPPKMTTASTAPIGPGGNRAILTQGDGSNMVLDSATIGNRADVGGGDLVKLADGELVSLKDGKLQYQAGGGGAGNDNQGEARFNTLTTPRGGQYQLVLSDGTKVWLNAASSIRYPTVFTGKDREVEVKGEVYFEVARDEVHPFKVSVSKMNIEVLGTSFNIKDYPDETDNQVHATLIQGAVRVSAGRSSLVLRPGQQANVSIGSQQLNVKTGVDLESVTAWVNGKLVLNGADIRVFMEEISRWFDVDIRYEGKVPSLGHSGFSGFIDRNVPLANLLDVLDKYGVKTRVEGRTIIIQ